MEFHGQRSRWSSYYENVGDPSWLDMMASVIYNERFLFRIIKAKPHSILEVGSGRGLHAIALSYLIPRVIGVDIDDDLIKKATRLNEKFKGKAEFSKMDAFHMGFDDDSFSICCSQGFFEHFPRSDIVKLLDEQLRVGRSAIFSVPSCYYPRKNIGDERLMSLQDWKKLMDNYVVNGFYYGRSVDTSKGILGVFQPKALERALSTPRKAQICITVTKRSDTAEKAS